MSLSEFLAQAAALGPAVRTVCAGEPSVLIGGPIRQTRIGRLTRTPRDVTMEVFAADRERDAGERHDQTRTADVIPRQTMRHASFPLQRLDSTKFQMGNKKKLFRKLKFTFCCLAVVFHFFFEMKFDLQEALLLHAHDRPNCFVCQWILI